LALAVVVDREADFFVVVGMWRFLKIK
jgi:hypothetical protein